MIVLTVVDELPWLICSRSAKPDPRVYQMEVNLPGQWSHEVMMVAAWGQGMQAAFSACK
jgi:hypothetical protein